MFYLVSRVRADLYALGCAVSGVALFIVGLYGLFGYLHLFGLSFHAEFMFGFSMIWVTCYVIFSILFRREVTILRETCDHDFRSYSVGRFTKDDILQCSKCGVRIKNEDGKVIYY